MTQVDTGVIERIFRDQYGRAVAVLVRQFGDIDTAEEAVQDAFTAALERWPSAGLPLSPAGWIITTARNRAIDRFRRRARHVEQHAVPLLTQPASWEPVMDDALPDDRLRLIFTCCHPSLSRAAQVALTLRLLGGLTTTEIARAFLVPEATIAQRLVRAKGKIRDAGIPYRIPDAADLPARLDGVLAVVYLVFNEGYAASSGDQQSPGFEPERALLAGVRCPGDTENIGNRGSARSTRRTRRSGSWNGSRRNSTALMTEKVVVDTGPAARAASAGEASGIPDDGTAHARSGDWIQHRPSLTPS